MDKVYIAGKIPEVGMSALKQKFEVIVNSQDRVLSKEEMIEQLKDKGISALVTLVPDKVDEDILTAAGQSLKIVANYGVGFDNIDVTAATKRNIFVTNTPGAANQAVAEHTIALMLALAKSLNNADKYVRSGQFTHWDPKLFVGGEVLGKTLGIIGVGHIGSVLVQIASLGFNMKILYNDIKPNPELEMHFRAKFAPVPTLLKNSDYVAILVPLLPSTRHLIDAEKLALMKPSAYLINTSRGPIVEEAALIEALKNKKIAGAALDVFESEPNINLELFTLENIILTPHIASATRECREMMARIVAANVTAALSGQTPPNLVKPPEK